MTIKIAVLGQKGGSGKSTTARTMAVALVRAGLRTGLADLDHTQKTLLMWAAAREALRDDLIKKGKEAPPRVPCEVFSDVDAALENADRFEFYILDAPGRTGPEILKCARAAHVVVLPCNPGADDMYPTIKVYNGLVKAGIPRNKLIVLLNHIGGAPEEKAARSHLMDCGLQVLPLSLKEKVAYRSALTAGLSPIEVKQEALRVEAEAVVKELLTLIIKVHGEDNGTEGFGEAGAGSNEAQVSAA